MRNKPDKQHRNPNIKGNLHILRLVTEACEKKYGRVLTFVELKEYEPEAHAIMFKLHLMNGRKVDPSNLQAEEMRAAQDVRKTYAELFLSCLVNREPLVDEDASKTVSGMFGTDGDGALPN